MNYRSGLLNLSLLLIAIAAFMLVSVTATAEVNFTVEGTNLTTDSTDLSAAVNGDQVQIDIFQRNPDSAVAGATFTAFGLDFGEGTDTLDFDGGSSAGFYFNTLNAKTGGIVQGLGNIAGTDNGNGAYYTSLALPRTISTDDISEGVIIFFSGLSPTTPAEGDGTSDVGIKDGTNPPFVSPNVDLTGNGAAHARLLFTVVGSGGLLEIGNDGLIGGLTDANAPGSVGTINNASIQVPEPGAVALGFSAMASVVAVFGLRRRTD